MSIVPAKVQTSEDAAYPEQEDKQMENNPKNNKAIVGEREMIRQMFIKRASEPPIPDPFSAESMARWEDYCEEMRGYEAVLAEM